MYLTYATLAGHAQIDRALPAASWAGDQERRAAAGVPGDVAFATKPELVCKLIVRALDGGAAAPWVTGRAALPLVSGGDGDLEFPAAGQVSLEAE